MRLPCASSAPHRLACFFEVAYNIDQISGSRSAPVSIETVPPEIIEDGDRRALAGLEHDVGAQIHGPGFPDAYDLAHLRDAERARKHQPDSAAGRAENFDFLHRRGLDDDDLPPPAPAHGNATTGIRFGTAVTPQTAAGDAARLRKWFEERDKPAQKGGAVEPGIGSGRLRPGAEAGAPFVAEPLPSCAEFARRLLSEDHKHDEHERRLAEAEGRKPTGLRSLSKTQMEVVAAVTEFCDRFVSAVFANPDTPREWPVYRAVLVGAGGAGKTHVVRKYLLKVIGHMYDRIRGVGPRVPSRTVICASSHAQAKNIYGETVHAAAGLHGVSGRWSDQQLRPSSRERELELQELTENVGAVFLEECSMMECELNYALHIRYTLGRAERFGLSEAEWHEPGNEYGRVPIAIWLGDFLQLRPRGFGLADDPATDGAGASVGAQMAARIFHRVDTVFELFGGLRFDDELFDILTIMRTPGGKAMPDELWSAFASHEVSSDEADARLADPAFASAHEAHTRNGKHRGKTVAAIGAVGASGGSAGAAG